MPADQNTEIIDSPGDLQFPFGRPIFDNVEIFYHGTTSSFTSKIEEIGWVPNDLPYRMSDVSRLCEIFDSLSFLGSSEHYDMLILQAFSSGNRSNYSVLKPISFSGSYWLARNYAGNRGGETIHAIIRAANDFEDLVTNPISLKDHQEKLANRLSSPNQLPGYPPMSGWAESVRNLADATYLEKCREEIATIRKYYLEITSEDYPIVYAVRLETKVLSEHRIENWLKRFGDLTRYERSYEKRINSEISPDAIVARADYVNGIDSWRPSMGKPLPLPWLITD